MLQWFNQKSNKVGFDMIHSAYKNQDKYLIINTLPPEEQDCLIKHTLPIHSEEKTINDLLSNYEYTTKIIILYGRNATDISTEKKCKQLTALGFSNVSIYAGGLFEWLLLQDIYGEDEFPTSKKILDILKYSKNATLSTGNPEKL
jgi:hypothetical protein